MLLYTYALQLPKMRGYLTNKEKIHLPRVELFVQELCRREVLYFQQRAVDERIQEYADGNYKEYYYQVKFYS